MPEINKYSGPFQPDLIYNASPLAIPCRQIARGRESNPRQQSQKAKSQPE
jgi:hypothetical protein